MSSLAHHTQSEGQIQEVNLSVATRHDLTPEPEARAHYEPTGVSIRFLLMALPIKAYNAYDDARLDLLILALYTNGSIRRFDPILDTVFEWFHLYVLRRNFLTGDDTGGRGVVGTTVAIPTGAMDVAGIEAAVPMNSLPEFLPADPAELFITDLDGAAVFKGNVDPLTALFG